MEKCFALKHENPTKKANILSKLTFFWMVKLFYKRSKRCLEINDLYKNLECDNSSLLGNSLQRNWEEELQQKKLKDAEPSLLRALSKTFFWTYMLYGAILFVAFVGLRPLQPIVLAYLIKQFGITEEQNIDKMYISASILVTLVLSGSFLNAHMQFRQALLGMRIRVALSSLIYRKTLKLSKTAAGQTDTGQVVNLLSNDVTRFDFVIQMLHFLWITPFQIAIVTFYMWQEVSISSLAGILSMALITLPGQAYMAKLTSSIRLKIAEKTDTRVRIMNEIISGIQVIKMYAWEKPFEKVVQLARKKEINEVTKASYLRGVYLGCMVFIERTTLFLTIICYVLLGNVITADKVFSLAQFFNFLQLGMAILIPNAINLGAESLVSVKRIQKFLLLEEKGESKNQKAKDGGVVLKNVDASWVIGTPTLIDFNVVIPPGSLCAVVGPVGAGKSSLLQLLLGELSPSSGVIEIGTDIAYASQEPWLFGSSVRNNILFGREYNRSLYKDVVHYCALERDFEQFPHGDRTIVGERGVSLSGGQRARINLARAVYGDSDYYLLDDPLSAVDTHVGKHLFEKCILKYLRGKTRILVTHQLQYLKKADKIILINEGRIEMIGTFDELTSSNIDFTKLLISSDDDNEEEQKKTSRKMSQLSISSSSTTNEFQESHYEDIREEEHIISGNSPFKDYVNSVQNCCVVGTLITVLILSQACCSGADYWVTFWTQQEAIRNANNSQILAKTNVRDLIEEIDVVNASNPDWYYSYIPADQTINKTFSISKSLIDIFTDEIEMDGNLHHVLKRDMAMYVYGAIIISVILLTIVRSLTFFKSAMLASKKLHAKMFHCLLKAPMRFFDTNPSGRILNRFSKDMGAIDEVLPRVLMEAIQIMLVMSGILVMVTIANIYMLAVIVILAFVFHKLCKWYIRAAKNIKHLEGITKSPMFSHVSSSLNGVTTIRASKMESTLCLQFDEHQDVHTSAWYLVVSCMTSFGLWLDIISVCFVGCVTFSFILLTFYGQVSGSFVGLAVSQSMILTGMLTYGIRQTAEVVSQLTSVDRVMQYTKLDTEEKEKVASPVDTTNWPKDGLIEFKNMSLRYVPDDPPVLHNLNITIQPGEKIGIVGRTGAGKTSLISALFLLAPIEGQILIDNVDTKDVALDKLRESISIIPQEPVLFSATIRYNLDPVNEFLDSTLWGVLEEVELKNAISSLNFMVTDGGSNFSVGQRQLICLARAILNSNKILVLDEATANVDPITDSFIQATIRKRFETCTVLTIAHRLNTIMDSDKVLVMQNGRIAEFDHPYLLIQKKEHFYKMLLETGTSMAEYLTSMAKKSYEAKQKEPDVEDTKL